MSKRVKIYGERNTNTNYLSQLIGLNLKAEEIPGVVPATRVRHALPDFARFSTTDDCLTTT